MDLNIIESEAMTRLAILYTLFGDISNNCSGTWKHFSTR